MTVGRQFSSLAKTIFTSQFNLLESVSLSAQKISLPFFRKLWLYVPSRAVRGAYAQSSRNVVRDAMDVACVAGRVAQARTAKSCGPDLPTLRSSLRDDDHAGEGGYQARHSEESAV
jgi:hypothetical protein